MSEFGIRAAEEFRKNAHKRDITYERESSRTGVSRQSFFQYETGLHDPSLKVLAKLIKAGYDVDYILTGERK